MLIFLIEVVAKNMIILAEKRIMEVAFNKILKEDIDYVIPFLSKLSPSPVKADVLKRRLLEMYDQNYECFGVYLEGDLIGVFGLWFMTRHYAGKCCEVDHIFLQKDFRKRGLGKQLFLFVEEYAGKKNCETLELNSYVENFSSHKFFMDRNFKIRGYHFLKKL